MMSRRWVVAALLVGVAAVGAAATPGTAAAKGWTGTLVAKDAKRGTIVTASATGQVRTVRARSAKHAVGAKLAVRAAKLADGTYRARQVRKTGVAAKAKVRGIVVRRTADRYLVSAGGSVVAIRAGARTTSGRSLSGKDRPECGDKVTITVTLGSGTPTATAVTTTGHASLLELEGIFLGTASNGALRLAVAKRGEVTVAVPAGATLPQLAPGDQIDLVVALDANGAFTLVQLEHDDGKGGADLEDDGEVEVDGTIGAISLTSVTVQLGKTAQSVTCSIPAGTTIPTSFAVGTRVEMECRAVGTALVLHKLSIDDHDDEDDEEDEDDDDHDDDDD